MVVTPCRLTQLRVAFQRLGSGFSEYASVVGRFRGVAVTICSMPVRVAGRVESQIALLQATRTTLT
ncbi:hypothetical protein C3476_26345 [Mycobacterium kansasii]|nr:hypothetical protein C3B43_10745 [Mycobacterium kansasii]POY14611.1 hypothetical protein C3476_26345 [Mycobacterium kansasii]